jgi:hypothetical protein
MFDWSLSVHAVVRHPVQRRRRLDAAISTKKVVFMARLPVVVN